MTQADIRRIEEHLDALQKQMGNLTHAIHQLIMVIKLRHLDAAQVKYSIPEQKD